MTAYLEFEMGGCLGISHMDGNADTEGPSIRPLCYRPSQGPNSSAVTLESVMEATEQAVDWEDLVAHAGVYGERRMEVSPVDEQSSETGV